MKEYVPNKRSVNKREVSEIADNHMSCVHQWVTDITYDDQSFDRHCIKCNLQEYVIAVLDKTELEELMNRIITRESDNTSD